MKVSGHLGLRKSRAFDAAGQDGYAHLEVHCHGAALQAKIDELIKATGKARDDLIGLENRGEDDIEQMRVNEGQRGKATDKAADSKEPRSRVPARYVRFPPKADITEFRSGSVCTSHFAPDCLYWDCYSRILTVFGALRLLFPSLASPSIGEIDFRSPTKEGK